MIRQTLRGLWAMWGAVWPVLGLAAPPIAGALLLEPVRWLGLLILSLWTTGLLLVVAYQVGRVVDE